MLAGLGLDRITVAATESRCQKTGECDTDIGDGQQQAMHVFNIHNI